MVGYLYSRVRDVVLTSGLPGLWPCRQCAGPVPFLNHITLSKSAILHRFPICFFLHIKGRNYPEFFPFWTACFFSKSGTQTHRRTDAAALYILSVILPLNVRVGNIDMETAYRDMIT